MNDDMLIDPDAAAVPLPAPVPPAERASAPQRPDGLPDKFWDEGAGAPRLDALVKSYGELERRLGHAAHVPDAPDGYVVTLPKETMKVDPQVNARMHKAGFSQAQAQVVYDMAAEFLVPYVSELESRLQADVVQEQLKGHFGGAERWGEASNQLSAWGKSNLPPDVYRVLSDSVEGVQALHRMMSAGEPMLGRASGRIDPVADEQTLREMMRHPRYWRDHDPAYVEQVREGFRRLYPD